LDLDLSAAGWALVTTQGARQRGWLGSPTVDPSTVERWVANAIAEEGATYVAQVVQRVQAQHGEVPQQTLLEAVQHVVQAGRAMTFGGQPGQSDRPPDLVSGTSAVLHPVRPEDVVITPAEASTRGWVTPPPDRFRLSGRDGAAILLPLLRQIGSLYARGALSSIAHLDLVDLEIPGGGRLRLSLESVPAASMKRLGELFETLATVINAGTASEADLEISDPDEQCLFMQALRRASPRR
jgi:hypothetical protein